MEKLKKHLHTILEPSLVRQGVMESSNVEIYNSYEMGEKINEIIDELNKCKCKEEMCSECN